MSPRVGRTASMTIVVTEWRWGVAGPAWGAFGISAFDGAVSDSAGGAFTQAGGHADTASTTFSA